MELHQVFRPNGESGENWAKAHVWIRVEGEMFMVEIQDGRIVNVESQTPNPPELTRETEREMRELARTTYQMNRGLSRAYSDSTA